MVRGGREGSASPATVSDFSRQPEPTLLFQIIFLDAIRTSGLRNWMTIIFYYYFLLLKFGHLIMSNVLLLAVSIVVLYYIVFISN